MQEKDPKKLYCVNFEGNYMYNTGESDAPFKMVQINRNVLGLFLASTNFQLFKVTPPLNAFHIATPWLVMSLGSLSCWKIPPCFLPKLMRISPSVNHHRNKETAPHWASQWCSRDKTLHPNMLSGLSTKHSHDANVPFLWMWNNNSGEL